MPKEQIAKIMEMFNELALEIRDLKEHECGNSGLNWYEDFIKRFPVPSDFE